MTLREYERRLQQCNPKLHIKTFGSSMAVIFNGNQNMIRVAPGEITEYNVFAVEWSHNGNYITDFNPKGMYKEHLIRKRGRAEAARILYTKHLITLSQVSQLS